jgi:hypothetical protein
LTIARDTATAKNPTMAKVNEGRWSARIDGDFVVFVIGARPELLHPIRSFRDIGGLKGMQHMLKHLSEHPDRGLLGHQSAGFLIVQYWRSFEHLEAFANDASDPHVPAWRRYWKRVGRDARSGIWHETYLVRGGEYEAIYANMPPTGLGKGAELVPLAADSAARGRIKRLSA